MRKPTQLAIDLPHRTALGRADFLVSASNQAAVDWVERWPDWPRGGLVLHGPAGCGKSHLLHVWRERAGGAIVAGDELTASEPSLYHARSRPALAVDDADRAPEAALLHLYN